MATPGRQRQVEVSRFIDPAWLVETEIDCVLGQIGGKHWSTVVTYREGRIRLISVRRSRKKEVELYES
ncbi:hypothetical protein BCA33_18775 [Marinobacter sp. AC-23]|nr:hypothetical protein BCA33_18775 [Marinobacter sp. AC-23]